MTKPLGHFISRPGGANVQELLRLAQGFKDDPFSATGLGHNKTLGLIFMNPSLRTRMSMQKAASNLGMNCLVMNIGQDGWGLETANGTIMNGRPGEHIKEAARVVGEYCDLIGVRSFPGLIDRDYDYSETVLNSFIEMTGKPVINMESSTLHPLQSLADLFTIKSHEKGGRPRVVLTWAPHIKKLPQSVANSFAQWMSPENFDLVLTHPPGYELSEEYTQNFKIISNQEQAFDGADFIYCKNWSSYSDYGKILPGDYQSWMIDESKMNLTSAGKFMHCLPVRRNMVVADDVLDSSSSIVIEQAGNRVHAAQAVLSMLLQSS